MQITIEKTIPIPANVSDCGRPAVFPFRQMEVGDSFAVPLTGEAHATAAGGHKWDKAVRRIRNAAIYHQRKHGMKFTVRELRDEGVARCWRVA
jgi:hypothetical protein